MAKRITASGQIQLFQSSPAKMPEGYYSGDKPNPNLRAFVERHIKEYPYNPQIDGYDVPAFDKTIETTKATAIYNMHTYWSKKPHDAIRQYIQHYTKPGDLVLDPFCGSGGTALAALVEGRKAIAIDRSPAATFITKNYCTPVDSNELRKAFEQLKARVKADIDWLYETRCDRCGGKATTAYTVYSQVFECPRCMSKVPLADCPEAESQTRAGKPKKVRVCPYCKKRGHNEIIRSQSKKFGSVPVLIRYICMNGCKPQRASRCHNDSNNLKKEYFQDHDLTKITSIDGISIPHWYPQGYDMTSFSRYQRDALFYYNVKEVADLYTKRNLWALAGILESINTIAPSTTKDALLFAFQSIVLINSRMCDAENTQINKGTYYLPQISKEIRPLSSVESKIDVIIKAQNEMRLSCTDLCISTQCCQQLTNVLDNSVDYVFTDPPYAGKVQYGELNYVWEAWLGLDVNWHEEEIIVNDRRQKGESNWSKLMMQAMSECFRVLKPGRWLSLCYHDTSEGTWGLIQDIMAEVGFIIGQSDSALFIDSKQKSRNQQTADKVNKRDLVMNFRKPKPGEFQITQLFIPSNVDEPTFRELARQIIREYLQAQPGASKDRIYDELVSRTVRAGKMEAHDFESILREVAEEVKEPRMKDLFRKEDPNLLGTHEISRWYLKDQELEVTDATESVKEDDASNKIADFIAKTIAENPSQEGVHYSDIFEQYVYVIKDKPRRPLSEWLLDYFYKTEEGTYRLPISEEEKSLKAGARKTGTNRKIKRYLALLEQGLTIPDKIRPNDATLAEWIRQCKRSGLYEQGKLLYEKGGLNLDKLPEDVIVNVEEDYQVCVRMLSRDTNKKE